MNRVVSPGNCLSGEDIHHLAGDHSTTLLAISALHECVLDPGVTLMVAKILQSVSLNLKVALDDEVLIVGGGEGDVVLSLVLLLEFFKLRIIVDGPSHVIEVLGVMESDTDQVGSGLIPQHFQQSISLVLTDIVILLGSAIRDEGLTLIASITAIPAKSHRVAFAIRQEDGVDDLDPVGALERGNLLHGADDCFVQGSASEVEATGRGMSTVMADTLSEKPKIAQAVLILPLIHATAQEVVKLEDVGVTIGFPILCPLFGLILVPFVPFIAIPLMWAVEIAGEGVDLVGDSNLAAEFNQYEELLDGILKDTGH